MTVDLSKLKVGDTVVTSEDGLKEVDLVSFRTSSHYPFEVRFAGEDSCMDTYTRNENVFGEHTPYRRDIVEIIPKVEPTLFSKHSNPLEYPFMKEYPAEILEKPKRFVDLLAEGVEYIKCAYGFVWKVDRQPLNIYRFLKGGGIDYEIRTLPEVLFQPATPAQNPEKKKKVVYNVLFKSGDYYRLSTNKFESVEVFDETYRSVSMKGIRIIEESREEIEE